MHISCNRWRPQRISRANQLPHVCPISYYLLYIYTRVRTLGILIYIVILLYLYTETPPSRYLYTVLTCIYRRFYYRLTRVNRQMDMFVLPPSCLSRAYEGEVTLSTYASYIEIQFCSPSVFVPTRQQLRSPGQRRYINE